MANLTERKKSDRATMATQIIALAQTFGAKAEIDAEWSEHATRSILVRIECQRGLCINIDFDGESCQPDTYVLSWHMSSSVDTCLSDAFGWAWQGHGINPHHYAKATYIAEGFEELCAALSAGFALAQSGQAFDASREAAKIARNGETAAERNAKRDRYWNASPAEREAMTAHLQ